MNSRQQERYGRIDVRIVSPLHRAAFCPYCQYSERASRRNALAVSAQLRGAIMAHIRKVHPDVLADDNTEGGAR
jgi:hypothetical protein